MGPGLTPRRGLCGVAAVVVAAAACASDPATPQQTAPDADAADPTADVPAPAGARNEALAASFDACALDMPWQSCCLPSDGGATWALAPRSGPAS